MRIAVTTPTGHVGSHLVSMLVRAGVRPLVLARDPARLNPEVRSEVDTFTVDLYDPDEVTAATAGVDALFWVDPTPVGEDPLAEHQRAAASVAQAVRENRIARTVFQSSGGAEKRHGVGEIDGLAGTEQALDQLVTDTGGVDGSGISVTHLRCGMFFTNLELQIDALRGGVIPVIVPVDLPMPWVAPRDIAEVAATRLLSTAWTGRVVQGVHGPLDLTWTQVAETVDAATGHSLRVEQIEDDAMRDLLGGAGLGPTQIDAIIGMSTGLREDYTPEQPRSVRTTTPTTLASWAHDVLAPQLSDGNRQD